MALMHERLTDEHEYPATRMQVGFTLLFVLVAVLGVNAWAIKKSPTKERTYDGLIVDRKWSLASNGAPAGGIAVVGDSGGNYAVVGSVLKEALGVPAVNLCTYGRFVMTGARWMLNRSVEQAEAPPSVALVVIGTQTLVKDVDGFTFAQVPVPFGEAASSSAGLAPKELAQFAFSRVCPLFTESVSFGNLIRHDQVVDGSRLPMDADGSSSFVSNQFSKLPEYTEKTAIPEIEAHEGPIPTVRDRQTIEQMIQDADSGGYDIVFVDGPIWNGMVGLPEQVELMRQFHEYIDAICATSERAWHLPGGMQTFEAAEMENPFHLMRPAALRYSAELADRLRSIGLPRKP